MGTGGDVVGADVTMIEDGGGVGEIVDEVVMRAGIAAGGSVDLAGGDGELSDDKTTVSNGVVWLVRDTSSSVMVASLGGPFRFPPGPGGPFLFPCKPGAFVFAGSRAARPFWKYGGFESLGLFGNIIIASFRQIRDERFPHWVRDKLHSLPMYSKLINCC